MTNTDLLYIQLLQPSPEFYEAVTVELSIANSRLTTLETRLKSEMTYIRRCDEFQIPMRVAVGANPPSPRRQSWMESRLERIMLESFKRISS